MSRGSFFSAVRRWQAGGISLLAVGRNETASAGSCRLLQDSLDSVSTCHDRWQHQHIHQHQHQQWRHQKKYRKHEYHLLMRPIDTNEITDILKKVAFLEHLAAPVLQYSYLFDPEQTTGTLEKLPRLLKLHAQRRPSSEQQIASRGEAATEKQLRLLLINALGDRFATVLPDCSPEQLTKGLWAMGNLRAHHAGVLAATAQRMSSSLFKFTPSQLATIAWAIAASSLRHGDHERAQELIHSIADYVARDMPRSSRRGEADISHRNVVKFAWAMAQAAVHEPAAVTRLAAAAAERIRMQLRAYDPTTGVLQPRATYRYKIISGYQHRRTPRPNHGPSKFMRDNSPKVILRDYTLSSLSSLLCSLSKLGYNDAMVGLLPAAAAHIRASRGKLQPSSAHIARVVFACQRLGYRNDEMVGALLHEAKLSSYDHNSLIGLMAASAQHGVKDHMLFKRLARLLHPQLHQVTPEAAAKVALACTQVNYHDGVLLDGLASVVTPQPDGPRLNLPAALAVGFAAARALHPLPHLLPELQSAASAEAAATALTSMQHRRLIIALASWPGHDHAVISDLTKQLVQRHTLSPLQLETFQAAMLAAGRRTFAAAPAQALPSGSEPQQQQAMVD